MFQLPTNLDAHERIWLVCERFADVAEVLLNAAPLGRINVEGEFEITSRLSPRNELLLDMNSAASLGEVRLEVRAEQFIRGLTLTVDRNTLRVTGMVAGESSEHPLELVVRDDQTELLYAEIGSDKPFDLIAPIEQAAAASTVEVRLIRGGTRIWESRCKLP